MGSKKQGRKKTYREIIKKQYGFRRFINSVTNSLAGLKYAYTNEQSLLIHIILCTIVIFAGLYFKISGMQWVLILFAASVIVVAELLNTAIEATVDLVTEEYHPLAKVAKDCASAAVFFISIVAGCVWLYVFIPEIIALFV